MSTPIGIIDLDAMPEADPEEIIEQIRQGIAEKSAEEQKEILEIARDLFTPAELTLLFGWKVIE